MSREDRSVRGPQPAATPPPYPDPADLAVVAPGALAGATALVTGAGTGIGRAVSCRLAALGARVVGIGRREQALAETGRLISDAGGEFVAMAANVRDRDRLSAVVGVVGRRFGIQILVNNAGGQFAAPAREITSRGWSSVLDLNLTAVATAIGAAYPWLAQRGGWVVNVSLSEPERGIAGLAHSAAARAGVLGLTRQLAREWRADGIALTCLAPGTVLTEGVRGELPPEVLREVVRRTPLGRDTLPEEVAEMVAFLATPAGALLSGQMIALDGGSSLTGAASALA